MKIFKNILFINLVVFLGASQGYARPAGNRSIVELFSTKLCITKLNEIAELSEDDFKIQLFGADRPSGSIIISENSVNTKSTQLELKFLTDFSKKGLKDLIKADGGAKLLIDLLLRIGAIDDEAKDPFYSELVLAAENVPGSKPVDLRLIHHNPVVEENLRMRRLFEKADRRGINPIIPLASEGERNRFLYWTILKALNKINDDDINSRNAIVAAFTEISRIDEYIKKGSAEQRLAQAEKILDGLHAETTYIRRKIELPELAKELVAEVPFLGFAIKGLTIGYYKYFDPTRELDTTVMNPADEHLLHEEVPNTYRVGFYERDPFRIQKNVDILFNTYFKSDDTHTIPNLYSQEFATALALAYPEINTVRDRLGLITNSSTPIGYFIADGPFGPATYEGYKVMSRMALTMALAKGDNTYFPKLKLEEFTALRNSFLDDLNLRRGTDVSVEHLDRFMTFLVLDALGRGRSTFLDSLDKELNLRQELGTNYERRSVTIIDSYRLAYHSFARLDENAQREILHTFRYLYNYNAGQMIQLEGGRTSFNRIAHAGQIDIASLFYRAVLSHAAVPEMPTIKGTTSRLPITHGSSTLTSAVFSRWIAFHALVKDMPNTGISPTEIYDKYFESVAKMMGLPTGDGYKDSVVRLAAVAHAIDLPSVTAVKTQFDMLSKTDKDILSDFFNVYPVLNFGEAQLFIEVLEINETAPFTDKPYLFVMEILAKAYTRIYSTNAFKDDLRYHPDEQKNVNFRHIVDELVKGEDPNSLLKDKFFVTVLKNSYEVQVEH